MIILLLRTWILDIGLRALLVILLAIFSQRFICIFIKKFVSRLSRKFTVGSYQKRIKTIIGIVTNTTGIVIYLIALIMVLSELGLNVTPLITGAGIAGLAFSFGAQTLVRDFISGIFILIENQFNQGDVIQVSGKTGRVERIGLRTTWLKDENGNVHIIPNSQLGMISIIKQKNE